MAGIPGETEVRSGRPSIGGVEADANDRPVDGIRLESVTVHR